MPDRRTPFVNTDERETLVAFLDYQCDGCRHGHEHQHDRQEEAAGATPLANLAYLASAHHESQHRTRHEATDMSPPRDTGAGGRAQLCDAAQQLPAVLVAADRPSRRAAPRLRGR